MWVEELSQFGINFDAQRVIKALTLIDFFAKSASTVLEAALATNPWYLYVNRSSTKDESEAG